MPTATAPRKTRRRPAQRGRTRRRMTPEDLLRFVYLADPQISPDGGTIAFVHKVVGEKNQYRTTIWTVHVDDGGAPRPFTNGGKDRSPRWSPDGERIAFVSERTKGCPQVHLISAHGGEATALTSFPEGSVGTVKWSPDGRWLAVSFRAQDPDWTEAAK
ncbi:MAG: TolB family protein, partial [Planctomycetota bacterium]